MCVCSMLKNVEKGRHAGVFLGGEQVLDLDLGSGFPVCIWKDQVL